MKAKIKNLFLAALMCASVNAEAPRIPIAPAGLLTATPTNVQIGTFPNLAWSISYPMNIADAATIKPPASIILHSPMYVSVQMIGSAVTVCNGLQNNFFTEASISIDSGAYQQLFYGDQNVVDSSYSLYIKKLNSQTKIDFSGRYTQGITWSNLYTSKNANFQVIALKNGDEIPTVGKIPKHLAPYIDASNKVKVGPMSVLILMELGDTNHSSSCFDYSDQVLHVSLSTKHPNNGHGNNLDGIDPSNPGQGGGGPNAGKAAVTEDIELK